MIRPLTTADIPAFLALRKQSWVTDPLSWDHEPDEKVDPEKWEGIISGWDNGSVLLGYFLSEEGKEAELVGLTGLQRYTAPKRSHRAMIWGVYVSPAARGQGISGKLLAESLARAREMAGLHHVILSVSHHAKAALRLYERAGFTEWGREIAAARTGEVFMDEIHMGLEI
jgi:RimJ/RimL family protein N-acetyltransferase